MSSINFEIDELYKCTSVRYLDHDDFEYKFYESEEYPRIVSQLNFDKLNFVFDLMNLEDDDGYSLVCTKSHRKKATKSCVQMSPTGEFIEFRLTAVIAIPLRADPKSIEHLKLRLKRLVFQKGTPDELSFEIDVENSPFVPFSVDQ